MSILDRMYFAIFVRNYIIVLVCLLSLYIVVDLFTNLNDFTNQMGSFVAVAKLIAAYYTDAPDPAVAAQRVVFARAY